MALTRMLGVFRFNARGVGSMMLVGETPTTPSVEAHCDSTV
ncbi:MAG: hypothetical protein ACFB0B_02325 [Thermonemataceae bacterium]